MKREPFKVNLLRQRYGCYHCGLVSEGASLKQVIFITASSLIKSGLEKSMQPVKLEFPTCILVLCWRLHAVEYGRPRACTDKNKSKTVLSSILLPRQVASKAKLLCSCQGNRFVLTPPYHQQMITWFSSCSIQLLRVQKIPSASKHLAEFDSNGPITSSVICGKLIALRI